MAVVAGQKTVAKLESFQRAIAIDKEIVLLEPSEAPLTVLTKQWEEGGNVRATDDFEFSWVEDERETRWDAVNHGGGYTEAEESVVVDTGEVFYAAALVKVPRTGEIMFASSVSTNTVTFKRGYAGTTAAALLDNDPLFVIGLVAEEGDTSPQARAFPPVKKTNYTQIFRNSIEASGSEMSSANMTNPHDWVHQHRKKNIEHLVGIEAAGLFGSKGSTTGANSKRISTSGGATYHLTSNNQDMGGTMTEAEFESWVASLCRYGSKKVALCSAKALSVINQFAVGRLQTIQADKDTTYGLAITEYVCAHGTVKLVKHNLLEGAVYGGYIIALDMDGAAPGYRFLSGKGAPGPSRDTRLLTNRQANDADGQKDEILTECGFQFPQVKKGGIATGITG